MALTHAAASATFHGSHATTKALANCLPRKSWAFSPPASALEQHDLITTEVPLSLLPPHSPQWSPQPQTSPILCIPSPPPPSLSTPPTKGLPVSFSSKAIFPLQPSPLLPRLSPLPLLPAPSFIPSQRGEGGTGGGSRFEAPTSTTGSTRAIPRFIHSSATVRGGTGRGCGPSSCTCDSCSR